MKIVLEDGSVQEVRTLNEQVQFYIACGLAQLEAFLAEEGER